MIRRLIRYLAIRTLGLESVDGEAAVAAIETHARDIFDLVE